MLQVFRFLLQALDFVVQLVTGFCQRLYFTAGRHQSTLGFLILALHGAQVLVGLLQAFFRGDLGGVGLFNLQIQTGNGLVFLLQRFHGFTIFRFNRSLFCI